MAINISPHYALLLLLAHLLSALAVYAALIPFSLRLAILFLLLLSLTFHLARDALLLLPASWRRLSIGAGEATIITGGGFELTGQLAGGCVVTPWFVILRIKPDGKYWPVARAIFSDALENDAFRELCVRLKFSQREV